MLSNIPPVILWKMCGAKNRYSTYRSAKQKRKYFSKLRRNRNKTLRVYQCPICDGWHLTSIND